MSEAILSNPAISVGGMKFIHYKTLSVPNTAIGRTDANLTKSNFDDGSTATLFGCNLIRASQYRLSMYGTTDRYGGGTLSCYPMLVINQGDAWCYVFANTDIFTLSIPTANTYNSAAWTLPSPKSNMLFLSSYLGDSNPNGSSKSFTIYYRDMSSYTISGNSFGGSISFTLEFYTLDTSAFNLS